MSLYLVKRGKYRVKYLSCGYKLRKRLENMGFGVGEVVEKLYKRKTVDQNKILTSKGEISLSKRFLMSILVEKVD